jgi:hypothetical protein
VVREDLVQFWLGLGDQFNLVKVSCAGGLLCDRGCYFMRQLGREVGERACVDGDVQAM